MIRRMDDAQCKVLALFIRTFLLSRTNLKKAFVHGTRNGVREIKEVTKWDTVKTLMDHVKGMDEITICLKNSLMTVRTGKITKKKQ